jgi:hypothetical protein
MKNVLLIVSLFVSSLVFSQDTYWYDVLLEVKGENTENVASLVDEYYSNIDIPENVSVAFSSIPLKGTSENATHIISIVADTSKALADFRNSLSGNQWDLYVSKMQKNVENVRASAGKGILSFNLELEQPVGQAWVFNVKDANSFVQAFGKLMQTFKVDGLVEVGQIVHGSDNGENMYIYGTYDNLSQAFDFGPKNDKEEKAFTLFNKEISKEDYIKTFTRVLIKRF